MTYFAIVGNAEFAQEELALCVPGNIHTHGYGLCTFDTPNPDLLRTCSTLIKRGIVSDFVWLEKPLTEAKLIAVHDKEVGKLLKNEWRIRRFKIIAQDHTDKECKEKWTEVVLIDKKKDMRWVVLWRQNIALYEAVDFGKPIRDMDIGIMPAKLAHFLLHLGILYHDTYNNVSKEYTIRDPFVGSGTTAFLANAFWYNVISSDIQISWCKKNRDRWIKTPHYTDHKHTLFKHDVRDPIEKVFIEHTDIIATEWRLWPVIQQRIDSTTARKNQEDVRNIFSWLLTNVHTFFHKPITIVCTIPYYTQRHISIAPQIQKFCKEKNRNLRIIPTLYQRKKQYVARQICIIQTQQIEKTQEK